MHKTLGILRHVGCMIDSTRLVAYLEGISFIEVDPKAYNGTGITDIYLS